MHKGRERAKTCADAYKRVGIVFGNTPEWITPIPKRIGPKTQPAGLLTFTRVQNVEDIGGAIAVIDDNKLVGCGWLWVPNYTIM